MKADVKRFRRWNARSFSERMQQENVGDASRFGSSGRVGRIAYSKCPDSAPPTRSFVIIIRVFANNSVCFAAYFECSQTGKVKIAGQTHKSVDYKALRVQPNKIVNDPTVRPLGTP